MALACSPTGHSPDVNAPHGVIETSVLEVNS